MEHVMICTLCYELPLDPVVTPCNHMFCRVCIGEALQHRSECPNDRTRLTGSSLRPIDGFIRRVWEQIGVKCPTCDWTGTVGNYKNHISRCVQQIEAATVADHQQQIKNLKSVHQRKIKEMESSCKQQMGALARRHERAIEEAREEARAEQLRKCEQILTTKWPLLEKAAREKHDPNYYCSHQIVELTQLICRNLESAPAGINRNRIFSCVKTCTDDLRAGYSDNPDYLPQDVRMLLSVCNAAGSRWFTARQRHNISEWGKELGWKA